MWVAAWNEVVFTDETRISLQHHDGRIRVSPWRDDAEQLRYTPPLWFCTGYYGMGRIVSHSSRTHCRYFKQPTQIFEVLEPVVLPYPDLTLSSL
ncbi:hypothetical protein TNCV_1454631 [Trichonephila clavipes]|nr:hypothetical protein TNCV_1454631 [Trichonephila clavipes]